MRVWKRERKTGWTLTPTLPSRLPMDSLLLPSLGEPALRFIPEAGPARICKAATVCSELEELSCWTLAASSHSSFDRVFIGHPSENAIPDSYDNCVKQESAPCVASALAFEAMSMVMFDRSKSMVPLLSPALWVRSPLETSQASCKHRNTPAYTRALETR